MIRTHIFSDGSLASESRGTQKQAPSHVIVGRLDIDMQRKIAGSPKPRDTDAYEMALEVIKQGIGGTVHSPLTIQPIKVTKKVLDDANARLEAAPDRFAFVADLCRRRVERIDTKHGSCSLGPWRVLRWCNDEKEAESNMDPVAGFGQLYKGMADVHVEPVKPWGPTHQRECPVCSVSAEHTEIGSNQCIVGAGEMEPVTHLRFQCRACSETWVLI